MAATFVVEDGSGKSDANAYISIAGADQYNDDHNADATWDALSDANKQKHLRISTQYHDSRYRNRWKGQRSSESQALAFPRADLVDYDGYALATNAMPQALKDSVTEGAILSAGGEDLLPDLTNSGRIKKTKDTIGPLTTEVEYLGGSSPLKKFSLIETLIRDLIESNREMFRS